LTPLKKIQEACGGASERRANSAPPPAIAAGLE
jgi:hypothetical protein